jgi:hypothetical protein
MLSLVSLNGSDLLYSMAKPSGELRFREHPTLGIEVTEFYFSSSQAIQRHLRNPDPGRLGPLLRSKVICFSPTTRINAVVSTEAELSVDRAAIAVGLSDNSLGAVVLTDNPADFAQATVLVASCDSGWCVQTGSGDVSVEAEAEAGAVGAEAGAVGAAWSQHSEIPLHDRRHLRLVSSLLAGFSSPS